MDVLRRGVKDLGVTVKLAFFAPAHELTPELRELFDANRLVVTRQVHHSESNTGDAVDLMLCINGLPVATAELKTQTAGQSMADAVKQYRYDRNAKDLVRTLRINYNKARQAAITTEILEIVSGAEALKG